MRDASERSPQDAGVIDDQITPKRKCGSTLAHVSESRIEYMDGFPVVDAHTGGRLSWERRFIGEPAGVQRPPHASRAAIRHQQRGLIACRHRRKAVAEIGNLATPLEPVMDQNGAGDDPPAPEQ